MPTDLPNLLTLSRIAAIPLLVVLASINTQQADMAACVVFSLAAITDYFDGKIARERGAVSGFGRMLDKAVLDNASNGLQLSRQSFGVGDALDVSVEDVVAAIEGMQ